MRKCWLATSPAAPYTRLSSRGETRSGGAAAVPLGWRRILGSRLSDRHQDPMDLAIFGGVINAINQWADRSYATY